MAGLTDWVDGFIARRWNLQTVVGSVIDPMADKTLMTILTVTLAMQGLLPGLASISFFLPGGCEIRGTCLLIVERDGGVCLQSGWR